MKDIMIVSYSGRADNKGVGWETQVDEGRVVLIGFLSEV